MQDRVEAWAADRIGSIVAGVRHFRCSKDVSQDESLKSGLVGQMREDIRNFGLETVTMTAFACLAQIGIVGIADVVSEDVHFHAARFVGRSERSSTSSYEVVKNPWNRRGLEDADFDTHRPSTRMVRTIQ